MIITKPVVVRGTPATFTLSKSELAQLPAVVADPYFSNQENWNTVALNYKSDARSQEKSVRFDAQEALPKGDLRLSNRSVGNFLIASLTIYDFDGDKLVVDRSELTVADFDVNF